MKSLLIIGGGGHGRVVGDAALDFGYERIAYLDDKRLSLPLPGEAALLGPISIVDELVSEWPSAIVALGDNHARLRLFERLRLAGFATPKIVHPAATISRGATLNDGVFVAAGAIINTGTHIGEATIVNTGARIDHDCTIGRGCHIAPGATLSGNVSTGDRVWLGTGCSVRQGIGIGDDIMVGVGAAVVSDLRSGRTYLGVPARAVDALS